MAIKGMTVTLTVKTKTGTDDLHAPIYTETTEDVHNVLVGQPETQDVIDDLQLYGKRLAYVLGIPKGDTHNWTDTKVQFWGKTFCTYGMPTQGIEENIPLSWNKKVKVELYED